MVGKAPVCHISPDQVIFDQPKPVKMPTIPPAVDLASALAAIRALTLLVQQLAGQQSVQGPQGLPGQPGQSSRTKVGRWNEIPGSRVTQTVRVFNPQDKTQYVDVERINSLTLQDNVTGEDWVWRR
jgi:hypothetical protein